MVSPARVLAVIPARGGSKSIPRKNILPLGGVPLIGYSIAAGLQAACVDRVVVSTDDAEIRDVAKELGAEVPFLRPAALALDDTPDLPVFLHALEWLEAHEGYHPDIVVQLRPTSPFRPPGMVDQAVQILQQDAQADSVRGVVPSGQNPHKMWRMTPKGHLAPLLEVPGVSEPYNAPRQSLPTTYWQTGHVDAVRSSCLLHKQSMTGQVVLPLVVDPNYTIDIDTPSDWQLAEWRLASSELEIVRPEVRRRPMPKAISLLVLDFDGVLTDDRVWVDENGVEAVAASRSDGMGISMLRQAGVEVVVLSSETNPVVAARCRKLGIESLQGLGDKARAIQELIEARRLKPESVAFMGNDVNDLPCFALVGYTLAPDDAHPAVRRAADHVVARHGGYGAVRQACEYILNTRQKR